MENTFKTKTMVDDSSVVTTMTDLLPKGVDDQIFEVTKKYVKGILPGLLKEGLSFKDITEDTDSMWDSVVELVGDLDEDVQKLFMTNLDSGDFSIWDYTYGGLILRYMAEMSKGVKC